MHSDKDHNRLLFNIYTKNKNLSNIDNNKRNLSQNIPRRWQNINEKLIKAAKITKNKFKETGLLNRRKVTTKQRFHKTKL